MTRAVVAIAAVILLASAGVYGFEAALATAGEDITIENETWGPDAGNVTELNRSNEEGAFYEESVTVRDENGTLSKAGEDYEWIDSNGTVKALEGGTLDGDTEAGITYSYEQTTEEQRQLAGVLAWLPRLIGLAAPAFVVVLFLLFLS